MKLKPFASAMAGMDNIQPWSDTIQLDSQIVTTALAAANANGTSSIIVFPPYYTSNLVDAITLRAVNQQPETLPTTQLTPHDVVISRLSPPISHNITRSHSTPDLPDIKQPSSPRYQPTSLMDSDDEEDQFPMPANLKQQRPAI